MAVEHIPRRDPFYLFRNPPEAAFLDADFDLYQ